LFRDASADAIEIAEQTSLQATLCRGNDAMMAENPMMETCSAMANNENRGIRCVAIAG
jgi:hypothetical protein